MKVFPVENRVELDDWERAFLIWKGWTPQEFELLDAGKSRVLFNTASTLFSTIESYGFSGGWGSGRASIKER